MTDVSTTSRAVSLHTPAFYASVGVVGFVSSGISHALVTPLESVKVKMQSQSLNLKSAAMSVGVRQLLRGALPTAFGFALHGFFKFSTYELLKRRFALAFGDERAARYRDLIYISSSAAAEALACVALCPFVTIAIRMQTNSALSTSACARQIWQRQGGAGFLTGLVPLWSRQVPYTLMKFVAFERIYELVSAGQSVEVEPKSKLATTMTACLLTGALAGAVSQPADVILTILLKSGTDGHLLNDSKLLLSRFQNVGLTELTRGYALRTCSLAILIASQLALYSTITKAIDLPKARVGKSK